MFLLESKSGPPGFDFDAGAPANKAAAFFSLDKEGKRFTPLLIFRDLGEASVPRRMRSPDPGRTGRLFIIYSIVEVLKKI